MKWADYFWSTLQIALIVLKLCGVLNSWWLVFTPIYITIGLYLGLYLVKSIISRLAEKYES